MCLVPKNKICALKIILTSTEGKANNVSRDYVKVVEMIGKCWRR
jgi:hypothetical protein